MNRAQKEKQISYLKEVVEDAPSLIFIDFSGVTVEEITNIRNDFRTANCEYKVIKNKLLIQAIKDSDAIAMKPILQGPIAIAFSRDELATPARIALQSAKAHKKFEVRGGFMDGELLDLAGVKILSKMPSKNELRSGLLATMLAVPQGLLRLMLAAPQRMLLVLDAKKRDME
jgi:large subunit ribosomal protein L10